MFVTGRKKLGRVGREIFFFIIYFFNTTVSLQHDIVYGHNLLHQHKNKASAPMAIVSVQCRYHIIKSV